jgi:hypothetical protein
MEQHHSKPPRESIESFKTFSGPVNRAGQGGLEGGRFAPVAAGRREKIEKGTCSLFGRLSNPGQPVA